MRSCLTSLSSVILVDRAWQVFYEKCFVRGIHAVDNRRPYIDRPGREGSQKVCWIRIVHYRGEMDNIWLYPIAG